MQDILNEYQKTLVSIEEKIKKLDAVLSLEWNDFNEAIILRQRFIQLKDMRLDTIYAMLEIKRSQRMQEKPSAAHSAALPPKEKARSRRKETPPPQILPLSKNKLAHPYIVKWV